MAMLLKNYDQHMSYIVDEMPIFNIVECLKSKQEHEKSFFYAFFNTQMFYFFLQVITYPKFYHNIL